MLDGLAVDIKSVKGTHPRWQFLNVHCDCSWFVVLKANPARQRIESPMLAAIVCRFGRRRVPVIWIERRGRSGQ